MTKAMLEKNLWFLRSFKELQKFIYYMCEGLKGNVLFLGHSMKFTIVYCIFPRLY